jgi:hypothetical protein
MMSSIWPLKLSQDGASQPEDNADVADTGLADVGLLSPHPDMGLPIESGRPQLQRNQPQPPPPHQPPPPPAPQQIGNPQDSLTLMQLRRIVTEFPKSDPTSYAFTYTDTATYEEEVNEWFSYNEAEFKRLFRAKNTFSRRWKKFSRRPWLDADRIDRLNFVKQEVEGLSSSTLRSRCKSLQTILHIILGVWDETAGLKIEESDQKGKETASEETEDEPSDRAKELKTKTKASKPQLDHMSQGIELLADSGSIPALFQVMREAFKRLW